MFVDKRNPCSYKSTKNKVKNDSLQGSETVEKSNKKDKNQTQSILVDYFFFLNLVFTSSRSSERSSLTDIRDTLTYLFYCKLVYLLNKCLTVSFVWLVKIVFQVC